MAGLVLSSYFAGFTLAALRCGPIIERVGHIRVYAAFAGMVVAATAAMPLLLGPLSWLVLRAVVGFGCAGLFITTESWLNAKAQPAERGRIFDLHGRRVPRPRAGAGEGAAAFVTARRRSRARLVASGCDSSDPQEDLARGTARDRCAHRRRLHPDDPALAGRRPHCAEAEDEWGRQASLDGARRYLVADARATDRAASQSRRKADRARQRLDQGTGLRVPQPPRHCRLSR